MYQIVDWRKRYEVSIKGREITDDEEELRKGPLAYVRLKVHGHQQGAGYRKLQKLAGKRFMEVFGIFCKLLEISGNAGREHRGTLTNEREEPASIGDLAWIIGIPEESMQFAANVLCEVNWISSDENNLTEHNTIQVKVTQGSGKIRKPPGNTQKTAEFDEFWGLVPIKISKGAARTAYLNARLKTSKEEIFAGLENYRQYEANRAKQTDYRPLHPSTWLNQERWADEPVAAAETATPKTKLLQLFGKYCSERDCSLPAVWKSTGEYEHPYCREHIPKKAKERLRKEGYDV